MNRIEGMNLQYKALYVLYSKLCSSNDDFDPGLEAWNGTNLNIVFICVLSAGDGGGNIVQPPGKINSGERVAWWRFFEVGKCTLKLNEILNPCYLFGVFALVVWHAL